MVHWILTMLCRTHVNQLPRNVSNDYREQQTERFKTQQRQLCKQEDKGLPRSKWLFPGSFTERPLPECTSSFNKENKLRRNKKKGLIGYSTLKILVSCTSWTQYEYKRRLERRESSLSITEFSLNWRQRPALSFRLRPSASVLVPSLLLSSVHISSSLWLCDGLQVCPMSRV